MLQCPPPPPQYFLLLCCVLVTCVVLCNIVCGASLVKFWLVVVLILRCVEFSHNWFCICVPSFSVFVSFLWRVDLNLEGCILAINPVRQASHINNGDPFTTARGLRFKAHANRRNKCQQLPTLSGVVGQQCCVRLHGPKSLTGFKLYATSANIVVVPCKRTQQVTTLLGPTMLGVVGQQCWVRLHGT